ncbi:MAG: ComEC/Rec2 family competence protein [Clostridia bacterium]|nr:ComEC/Rec2 family competence protein [Clostridia bacterium]
MAVIGLMMFTVALIISLIIKPLRRQSVFPVAFAAAAIACLLLVCVNEFYYYPQLQLADDTHIATITITSEMEKKNGNYYYEGKTTLIDGEKSKVKVRLVFNTPPEVNPYDKLEGEFTFFALGSSSDEAAASYKAENLFLGAYGAERSYNILPDNSRIKPVGYYVISLRNAVKGSIMKMLPNDYGALCTALVLGDRSALSQKAYYNLRACGVTHIICVSGLHISIWSAAFLWVLRKMRLSEKMACGITIPILILLMLAAGMTYSVIRSGIMMIIYLVSVIVSRRRDSLNSLGIAITIILAFNPFAAGATGLQLSALSTLGIILYSEFLNPKVNEWFKNHKSVKFTEKPLKLLIISMVAVLFCLPVSLRIFGNFNMAVFPANLLIVSAAEGCMITSVLGVLAGLIPGNLFNIPGFIAGCLAKYIIKISALLSGFGRLNIHISEHDAYLVLCAVFMFLALTMLVAYTGKKVMVISSVMTAVVVIISVTFFSIRDSRITHIRVADTGNGQAVLVSYKNENLLIGCGGDNYDAAYQITDSIEKAGGKINALVIPKNDKANTSLLFDVAKQYEPKAIYCKNDLNLIGLNQDIQKSELNGSINLKSMAVEADDNGNVTVTTDDTKLLVLTSENASYTNNKDCQIVVGNADYPAYFESDNLCLYIVEADENKGFELQQQLISQGVKCSATAGNGSILITAHDGSIYAERY